MASPRSGRQTTRRWARRTIVEESPTRWLIGKQAADPTGPFVGVSPAAVAEARDVVNEDPAGAEFVASGQQWYGTLVIHCPVVVRTSSTSYIQAGPPSV